MKDCVYHNKDGNFVDLGSEKIWELGDFRSFGLAYAEVKESKLHYHNSTQEIYLVVGGEGTLILDDREFKLKGGHGGTHQARNKAQNQGRHTTQTLRDKHTSVERGGSFCGGVIDLNA